MTPACVVINACSAKFFLKHIQRHFHAFPFFSHFLRQFILRRFPSNRIKLVISFLFPAVLLGNKYLLQWHRILPPLRHSDQCNQSNRLIPHSQFIHNPFNNKFHNIRLAFLWPAQKATPVNWWLSFRHSHRLVCQWVSKCCKRRYNLGDGFCIPGNYLYRIQHICHIDIHRRCKISAHLPGLSLCIITSMSTIHTSSVSSR